MGWIVSVSDIRSVEQKLFFFQRLSGPSIDLASYVTSFWINLVPSKVDPLIHLHQKPNVLCSQTYTDVDILYLIVWPG